jgi:FG-GAP repeat
VRARAATLAAAAVVTGVAGGAVAGELQAPPTVRVPEDARVVISGATFARGFPRSADVEPAGDVNGDKKPDLLVLNVQEHAGDETHSHLILGGRLPASLRLDRLGRSGVALLRSRAGDRILAAGDVDGDGRADVVRCGRRVEVLLGRPGVQPASGDTLLGGQCGTAPGDVDGDGLDDLLLFRYLPNDLRSVVVFGRRGPRRTLDVARLGRNGFQISAGRFAYAIPVGDLDGDKRADLGVEHPRGGTAGLGIVFGRRRTGTLVGGGDRPTVTGVRYARFGAAGDVNGDGIGDLTVAEPNVRVCIVFGRRPPWPSRSGCTATRGLVVRGADGAHALAAVEPVGDIDGDGNADVVVSAPGAPRGYPRAETTGAVYLVYGRAEPGRIVVPTASRVLEISGGPKLGSDGFGDVTGPGDITADGRADLVLGSPWSGDGWVLSP